MIGIFDKVVKILYEQHFILNEEDPEVLERKKAKRDRIICSITHLDKTIGIRQIEHTKINRLISVKGIIIRCSDIYPEMTSALFRCCNCRS